MSLVQRFDAMTETMRLLVAEGLDDEAIQSEMDHRFTDTELYWWARYNERDREAVRQEHAQEPAA